MDKKKRNIVIALVIMLAIGFASVSTTLVINGLLAIGENSEDFKIIFTSASIDGAERNDVIRESKTEISYETKVLSLIDEESTLEYEATNTSRNYDANVQIVCNIVDENENIIEGENEYVDMTYTPESMSLLAGETKQGSITAKLKKSVTESMNINIKCTLTGIPKERDELGVEYIDPDRLKRTIKPIDYRIHAEQDLVILNGDKIWDENIAPYVTKITFEDTLIHHDTKAELIFDISANSDESVLVYLVENEEIITKQKWDSSKGTYVDVSHVGYDLYIQADGKVIANENSSALFADFEQLKTIENLQNLDTSNVVNMEYMFQLCKSLVTLDLTSFDTSKVITMHDMFGGCHTLTNLIIKGFDTSKVTDMSSMFCGCLNLTNLNLNNFDTSNVTNMEEMFSSLCREGSTTLNLSNFNTSKVTNMAGMFEDSGLTNLDLSSFDTKNVTNMSHMFWSCDTLKDVKLSNFNTSKVLDMQFMFSYCESLITLDLSSFETSNVTDMTYMFSHCSSLTDLDISGFDVTDDIEIGSMFWRMGSEITVKVKNEVVQNWVLTKNNSRPAAWTTENVIIKEV